MNLSDLIFPKKCLGCKKEGVYLCKDCLLQVPLARVSYPGVVSLWAYRGVIRLGIISLKYKFATEVAKELAELSTLEIKRRFSTFPKKAILVPIPLYWKRFNWRGFNQSALVGEVIARKMGWKFIPDLLIRKKSTTPQVQLKKYDRSKNIRGVFEINPSIPISQYPSIIIFDDVMTTGSTLKEAIKVLRSAGAREVCSLTIAG